MGLFDFFRKKDKPAEPSDSAPALLCALQRRAARRFIVGTSNRGGNIWTRP